MSNTKPVVKLQAGLAIQAAISAISSTQTTIQIDADPLSIGLNRPVDVAVVADALVGVFYGLLCGGALAMGLAALQLVTPGQMLWPLLLIPLGAVAVPLWRVWRSPRDPRAPHGPD